MTNTDLLPYIKEYRQLKDKIRLAANELESFTDQLKIRRISLNKLQQDKENMQQIITKIIDEDIDSVEARLKIASDDMLIVRQNIWRTGDGDTAEESRPMVKASVYSSAADRSYSFLK